MDEGRPVKTATLNGNVYDIDIFVPFVGCCDYPHTPPTKPTLRLSCELCSQVGVQALLHEIGHSENWNLPEAFIDRFAEDAGKLFWRLLKSGQLHA